MSKGQRSRSQGREYIVEAYGLLQTKLTTRQLFCMAEFSSVQAVQPNRACRNPGPSHTPNFCVGRITNTVQNVTKCAEVHRGKVLQRH